MRLRGLSNIDIVIHNYSEMKHALVWASALAGCSAIDSFQAAIALSKSSMNKLLRTLRLLETGWTH